MRLAKPHPKLPSTPHPRPALLHPLLEIARAPVARVEPREAGYEAARVGLLLGGGALGVGCRDGVEERPGGAAEDFDVGGAVGRWLEGEG